MTTRWKQKASLALAIAAVLLLFLVIILLWSAVSNDMLTTNSRNKNINIKENHVNYISTSTNNINNNNNNNNYNKNDDTNSNNNININNNKSFNDYDKSEKNNINKLNDNNENHNFEILRNSRISQETTDRTHQNINNKINNNINEEFVKPSKIHHLPLHTEDLLYASERNKTLIGEYYQGYKITGNYRNISSKIWDPHPEYSIKAFGHVLHLILYQDTSFMHSTLKVTHVYENKSDNHHSHNEDHHHLACHYKGHVLNDENSVVSVSLCNGMAGHIRTSFGSYLIQPIDEYTKDDTEMLHKIWKDSGKNNNEFDNIENNNGKKHSSCSIDHHISDENTLSLEDSSTTSYNNDLMSLSKRSKRSIYYEQQYKLEVLIAVDRQTIEFHGTANIKSYVLTLMGIVSSIFMDASIGNSIHVVVADILLIEDDFNVKSFSGMGVSAAHYLKHFCRFIQKKDYHYDTAVLITRQTICRNETEIVCNTLGLAELGTACKENSCSLVVDNGLTAAFTIAHELGHIFNAPHDDDTKCSRFSKNGKNDLNIMASTMGLDIHPWTWSDCSRAYIDDFLEKEDVSCMENDPRTEIKNNNKHFPGELYNLDQQCELIIGPEATFCDVNPDYRTHQNYECRQLYCHDPTTKNFTCRMNGPWADGTPCRDFAFYWCQKGECVPRDNRALKPVQGGWGQWSPYTPCSRTCGGGIQISIRECNSPVPQNGGKYCVGTKKRHLSCNTEECPSHLLDIREQQCFDRNGDNFNIPGLGNDVRWVPKYGVEKRDECKLFCRIEGDDAYFQLAEKVLDGTTCSYESFDKCINGVCHKGGCDNRINSPATLDRCGVCDGRSDTCDEVTKNIYRSDLRKKLFSRNDTLFHHAGIIPKAAANLEIIIKEASRYNKHASYIALFDDHGKNLLNGKKKNKSITISSYKTVFYYDGVTFEYSGSNSLVQRVNTTYSRKLKRDLYIDVIGILNDNDPDDEIIMTYSYTISRMEKQDNDYHYNNNNNNIHTTSSHLYPNRNSGSHQNHPTYHHNKEPSSQQEIYKWEVDQWSPCDSICQGQRSRSIVCVHVDAGHKVASSYCESSKKPDAEIHGYCNTDCELIPNKTSLSECSASCGSLGTRAIAYQCIQKFINGSHSIVDLVFCYNKYSMNKYEDCREACWSYSEWEPCSQSCGSGQQSRQVLCIFDGNKVDESKCNQMKKRHYKEVLRLCNTEPCPAWGRDERTPCSVTCGNGQRTTAIYCMQNNEIVDSNLCSDLPMPKPIILNCSMPSCPTEQTIVRRPTVSRIQPSYSTTYIPSYHVIRAGQQHPSYHPTSEIMTNHINSEEEMASWQLGEWGECDDMCERNRTVTCEGAYPRNCPMSLKPLHRKKCCNIKYVAKLTPCSAECGNGVRHKEFHCARVYRPEKAGAKRKKIPIDSNYCRNLRKPNAKNFTKPCKMTCGWSYGQWTECPSDCSTDYATRNINCITKDRRQISDKYCDEKRKPTEHKKCLMCNRPAHVEYKISNCTCDGYRRRRVICYDSKQKHIPCTSQYISTKEKCKAPPNCQPRSCQEIRRYQKIYIDGEYTISIKRKPVKIYCYNMNTNRPIEFITLDSLENYSVYYDKRAKNVDKCPDAKVSRDIEEFRDPSISSGSTSFHKIRINLHTMIVNTNDYTFAIMRGNSQSLGSAGDCYNQNQKCPQGYFSINLSNTGFRIRPTVKWDTIGHYTSMEFATKLAYPYQIVRAFCGGYCGHCSISSNSSLILDVI